jgi:hypothetical protein
MKALFACAMCSAIGCTSSAGNVNDGTKIGGTSFTAAGVASIVRTERGLTNLDFTDFANACSNADESEHATSKTLRFLLSEDSSSDESVPLAQPGTYKVWSLADPLPSSGPYVICEFIVDDATCRLSLTPCDSGHITLTRADATGYAGSFEIAIAGDDVTGDFDTTNCSGVSESGFGTCH